MVNPETTQTLEELQSVLPKEWNCEFWEDGFEYGDNHPCIAFNATHRQYGDGEMESTGDCYLECVDDERDAQATVRLLDYLESLGWTVYNFRKKEDGYRMISFYRGTALPMITNGKTRSGAVARAVIAAVKGAK